MELLTIRTYSVGLTYTWQAAIIAKWSCASWKILFSSPYATLHAMKTSSLSLFLHWSSGVAMNTHLILTLLKVTITAALRTPLPPSFPCFLWIEIYWGDLSYQPVLTPPVLCFWWTFRSIYCPVMFPLGETFLPSYTFAFFFVEASLLGSICNWVESSFSLGSSINALSW